ncbi:hypothetical protein F4779DRAFT_580057 [Xylariaceae sp. FL0662B]|nr:hypothetical protein F4779DRAFT_580057 [Xylariaceae sp. FL0662B]
MTTQRWKSQSILQPRLIPMAWYALVRTLCRAAISTPSHRMRVIPAGSISLHSIFHGSGSLSLYNAVRFLEIIPQNGT